MGEEPASETALARMGEETAAECELLGAMFEGCAGAPRGVSAFALTIALQPTDAGVSSRLVSAVVELILQSDYPRLPPATRLAHARGLVDKEERELLDAMSIACDEADGERCCLQVITAAQEALAAIAVRAGECAVCFEELSPLDGFRAGCEHNFHGPCILLWRHTLASAPAAIADSESAAPEEVRLRAANSDLALAFGRIEMHAALTAGVRTSLEQVVRQIATLERQNCEEGPQLRKLERQYKDTISEAKRESERLRIAAARLKAKAAQGTEAANRIEGLNTILP
ncbi:hypothetical protein T492DRAFT_496559 [Pavlovales sp. CCMP2436]|nr:hypothetical protein T492DRAFT_496559 [Pavlovales sp. CCMP2436]